MEIGSVIREKRTAQGLTQEQVATALGVSAPAVSKWERGESFPEITLLPALARLLGTDLNGLLSFQQEMGREEIAAFLGRLVQAAEEGPQAAFALARAQVGQFPRCDSLALNVALTLEGVLTMAGREGSAEEREWIQALYRQAAESRDQAVACQAQAMLFGRAMEEGDFAQAEALLDRLPPQALYDRAQTLPLPEMYGKNLTFKTGGVDGCDSQEILDLIAAGKLDTTPLITHTYPLKEIEAAYDLFENRRDGVIKVAVIP